MAKRMTREQAETERQAREAMEFKAEAQRVREQVVVDGERVLFSEEYEQRFGRPMVSALYRALDEARRTREEYERKLNWLRDACHDHLRELSEGRCYSSVPLQNADDANHAHGQHYQARQAAASLCSALGVHCPALESQRDLKLRETLLSYTVVPVDMTVTGGQYWVVNRNGERATEHDTGAPLLPSYDEEWKAWRAVRVLVHGR